MRRWAAVAAFLALFLFKGEGIASIHYRAKSSNESLLSIPIDPFKWICNQRKRNVLRGTKNIKPSDRPIKIEMLCVNERLNLPVSWRQLRSADNFTVTSNIVATAIQFWRNPLTVWIGFGFGQSDKTGFYFERDAFGWRVAGIFELWLEINQGRKDLKQSTSRHEIGPYLCFTGTLGDHIPVSGGIEGSPDKKHAESTQNHTNYCCTTHELGPKSGDSLRNKVLLLAMIVVVFLFCLGYAVVLETRRQTEAALALWAIGVSGIFATAIVGIPFIFGLAF